jgi:hypothetical protein
MLDSKLIRAVMASCLACALLVASQANLYALDGRTGVGVSEDGSDAAAARVVEPAKKLAETDPPAPLLSTNEGAAASPVPTAKDQAQGDASLQGRTIVVGDRTLTGTFSSTQQRGGRIFLPVASIARALGDTIKVSAASRTVEVHRQTGVVADFNAQLNQVRENGASTLSVSNTSDITFPPNPDELMLPLEIVSALLDVSIHLDEATRTVRVTRGGQGRAETVRAGAKRGAFELYQVEYDYNLNLYSSSSNQNLTLRSTGRLFDGRFNLLTNSSVGSGGSFGLLRNFTLTYERPNGQRLIAGDFGTGTDLLFMSSTVRGAWAQASVGGARVTAFGGRAISGVYPQATFLPALTDIEQQQQQAALQTHKLRYDTNVFGAYATFGSPAFSASRRTQSQLSVGLLHFNGAHRSGEMLTASASYSSARGRFQGDFGLGKFKGAQNEGARVDGVGLAADLSASYDVSDRLTLQGRYTHIGANFLGLQAGLHDPVRLAAFGVTWRPVRWATASLTGSFSRRPDALRQKERFAALTLNITPRGAWPSIFFSHTASSNTQTPRGSYTLVNLAKDFSRWHLYLNATRVKTLGPAFLNAQVGATLRLNEYNSLQLSQAMGSRGALAGTIDWQTQSFLGKRIQLGAGFGYNRSDNAPLHTSERLSATVRLPRQSTLQFTYLQSPTGPQLLVSLRGALLRGRRTELAAGAPVAEINSYGSFYGRVYQDMNLNGRFDPGTDVPQSNVKVRVDGNRYVVSDASGLYRIDNVHTGDHNLYLDLLTVRADLTLLDGAEQSATLLQGRDSIIDFRLVRTGRITGTVWLDLNGNGRPDEGEQPLTDVRIVAGSGRDTLTDENGVFHLGDLPPGAHAILVDEKTLPEKSISPIGTLSVTVLAGSETANINFPITPAPPEVKRFPAAGN